MKQTIGEFTSGWTGASGQVFRQDKHIGRGGRVGHDNKGLNEIDSQCVGRENSFQKVR